MQLYLKKLKCYKKTGFTEYLHPIFVSDFNGSLNKVTNDPEPMGINSLGVSKADTA